MRCAPHRSVSARAGARRIRPRNRTRLLRVRGGRQQLQALHLPEVRGVAQHVHEHQLRNRARAQRRHVLRRATRRQGFAPRRAHRRRRRRVPPRTVSRNSARIAAASLAISARSSAAVLQRRTSRMRSLRSAGAAAPQREPRARQGLTREAAVAPRPRRARAPRRLLRGSGVIHGRCGNAPKLGRLVKHADVFGNLLELLEQDLRILHCGPAGASGGRSRSDC